LQGSENQYSERHTFLRGISEIFPVKKFSTDVHENVLMSFEFCKYMCSHPLLMVPTIEALVAPPQNSTSFWAFAAMQLESLFLWDMAPHHWVIGAHCYQTTWWSHLQGLKNLDFLTLEDETTMLSATSDTTHPCSNATSPKSTVV